MVGGSRGKNRGGLPNSRLWKQRAGPQESGELELAGKHAFKLGSGWRGREAGEG